MSFLRYIICWYICYVQLLSSCFSCLIHNGTELFYQPDFCFFAVNVLFFVSGICLNSLVILSFWRSSQLRKKLCYFTIMILSCCDCLVPSPFIPIHSGIYWAQRLSNCRRAEVMHYRKTLFRATDLYTPLMCTVNKRLWRRQVLWFACGFNQQSIGGCYRDVMVDKKFGCIPQLGGYSLRLVIFFPSYFFFLALLVMNFDRYLATYYPIFHRTSVTKGKRLTLFVILSILELILELIPVKDEPLTLLVLIILFPPMLFINYKLFIIVRKSRRNNGISAEMKETLSLKNICVCIID